MAKNFKLSEFACKDGTAVPKELISNVQTLAENLQVLRDSAKTSIKINSSYRTKSHNDKVGGSLTSQHLVAKTADIVITGFSPIVVKATIEKLIKEKKMLHGGLGFIIRLFTTIFVAHELDGKHKVIKHEISI